MAWAPDYVTLAEMKVYLRNTESVSTDDATISAAITGASRAVDGTCHRQFGIVDTAEERIYRAYYDVESRRWLAEIDDLMTTTNFAAQVSIDGSNVGAIDSYVLEPRNAARKNRPWTIFAINPGSSYRPSTRPFEVALTGIWGWTAVPTVAKQATYLQANRFCFRQDSPAGVAGSPSQGSEIRLQEKLDVDVAVTLNDYMRWREPQ